MLPCAGGEDRGARTLNFLLKRQALYQLSYVPEAALRTGEPGVEREGLEPPKAEAAWFTAKSRSRLGTAPR